MEIQGHAGAVQVELLRQGARCRAGKPFLGHGSVGMVVRHTLEKPVPDHEGGDDGQRQDAHPVSHRHMIKGLLTEVNCESFLSDKASQASGAGSRPDILRSRPRRDRDDGGHMDKDEIRRLYEWIQGRVELHSIGDDLTISFDEPAAGDLAAQGFSTEAVERTIGSSWWREMVTDIVETPEFAEPDDSPEQVLAYAKDVVREYIWKRLY